MVENSNGPTWKFAKSFDCLGLGQDVEKFAKMNKPAMQGIRYVEAHAANGSVADIKSRIKYMKDELKIETCEVHGRPGWRSLEPQIIIGSNLIMDTPTGLAVFGDPGYLVHTPEAERHRQLIFASREKIKRMYIENHSDGAHELAAALKFVQELRNEGMGNVFVMLDSAHTFTKKQLKSKKYLKFWNEGGIRETIAKAIQEVDAEGNPLVHGIHLHVGRKIDDAFNPDNPETEEIIKDHRELLMQAPHIKILVWEQQLPNHAVLGIDAKTIRRNQEEVHKAYNMFKKHGLVYEAV